MSRNTVLATIGIGFALCTVADAAAEPATVKVGATMPSVSSVIAQGYVPWLRAIERDSGGAVKFQEFWGGALVRAPTKQYEGMMNGIMDSTVVITSYTQNLFPDFSLFSIPYIVNGAVEAAVGGWRLYEKGLLRGLDKVYVAAIFSNDNGGLHLRNRIKSLDEVKGLKIRVSGPEESEIVKAMGAVPVGLGIPTTADALNRGVVDGTFNGWAANQSFRITPLIKTHISAPFGVRSFFIAINREAYDKLPAPARAAIDKNSGRDFSIRFGQVMDDTGAPLRNEAVADPNRAVIEPNAEEARALKEKFMGFHKQWIEETPDGARKYREVKDAVAEFRRRSS